jgi:hypothetical protein
VLVQLGVSKTETKYFINLSFRPLCQVPACHMNSVCIMPSLDQGLPGIHPWTIYAPRRVLDACEGFKIFVIISFNYPMMIAKHVVGSV